MEIDPKNYPSLRKAALGAAHAAGAGQIWVENIADEAIERLLKHEGTLEKPTAWIRVVATNLAREAHRRQPAEGWAPMPLTAPNIDAGERPYPEHLHNRLWASPAPNTSGRNP